MHTDPSRALTRELQAKAILVEQIRTITADDPEFFQDLVEGETNLIELIGFLDASIVDDDIIVEGAKSAIEKLSTRRKSAEHRIDLKRRLLAHALSQIGVKTLRTPTATLTLSQAPIKAIVLSPEEIPSTWWKAQAPRLDQEALTKAIRARCKALEQAEALPDGPEREKALTAVDGLYPEIPGVIPSEPSLTLVRRV